MTKMKVAVPYTDANMRFLLRDDIMPGVSPNMQDYISFGFSSGQTRKFAYKDWEIEKKSANGNGDLLVISVPAGKEDTLLQKYEGAAKVNGKK